MANLFGQNIGTNYKGILSLDSTINTPLDATLRAVTDGEGNASGLKLSTSDSSFSGNIGIGTDAPTYNLDINGTVRVQGGSGTYAFDVLPTTGVRILASSGSLRMINSFTKIAGSAGVQLISSTFVGGEETPTARLHVKGSGTTSATTALLVQNSAGTDIFKVTDNGAVTAFSLLIPNFSNITSGSNSIGFETSKIVFTSSFNTISGQYAYNFSDGGGFSTQTSGILGRFNLSSRFAPTSGTAIYNTSIITPIINQTGGANGITRGLFIDPTLTSAADFRAIETTNGKVVFGNLPTSAAGLPSGAIWNNSGVINIV